MTAIVAMVGKGMTAREILDVFPELKPEDIREALLRAAEVISKEDVSLSRGDRVGEIIRSAQRNSGLSEEAALKLAVQATRAVRRARAKRRNK